MNLASVSCGSTGNCAAVGDYVDGSYRQQGLLINYRKGVWRQGVRVALPAGARDQPAGHGERGLLRRHRLLHGGRQLPQR